MGEESTIVGQLALELNVDTGSLVKQLTSVSSGIEKKTTSIFSGMGKKLGAALGFAALTKFTAECVSLGSELSEVQNVVDTTFTSMSGSVNEFAKNAMKNYGLSKSKAKNYVSTLGAMSQSMGMTESAAYDMSTTVAGLAGDVASFYNLDADEAYNKLKGIWTGETEALKSLGVVMTQTALDQYALNNGFGKTTAKMTEQEKLMLRYQYVTTALGKATGDFVKTQDSWANQTRILSLRFESIKATLGQGFINILTPLLRQINALMEGLSNLAEGFTNFTAAIFGTSEAGTTLDSISSSASDLSGDIDGVSESASEALKELAGFDKITKLGSSSGTSSLLGDYGITSGEASEAKKATEGVIGSFSALKESLQNLKEAFEPFAETVGEGLHWLYTEILVPLAKWTIGDVLPAFLDLLAGVFDVLNGVLKAFKPFGEWLWNSFLKPIAEWTGGIIVDFLSDLAEMLSAIGKNETACDVLAGLVTTFAAFSVGKLAYKGLTKLVDGTSKLNGNLSGLSALGKISLTIAIAFVAADVGFNLGNSLYELLTGEDVDMSASMQIKYLADASWDEIGKGLKMTFDDVCSYIKGIFGIESDSHRSSSGRSHNGDGRSFDEVEIPTLFEWITDGISNLFSKNDVVDESEALGKAMAKGASNGYTSEAKKQRATVKKASKDLVDIGIRAEFKQITTITKQSTSSVGRDMATQMNNSVGVVGSASKSLIDNGFKSQFSTLNSWASTTISGIKNTIVNSINSAQGSVGSAATKLVNNSVKQPFSGISGWFSSVFSGAWDSAKKSFTGNSSILSNIKSGFNTSFTQVANNFITGFNEIVSKPFGSLNGILNKMRNISILGIKPFAKLWSSNPIGSASIPLISMLAEGGYVKPNTPQLAVIGDNRHQGEVVAPEDKLTEMAMEAVRASDGGYNREILATLKLILNILQTLDLNIVVDGKKLKDIIVDRINANTKATGVCEIIT